MRIVRVANFVTATSGGLRTALHQLGVGYRAAGHDTTLIVPGETAGDVMTDQGRVVTIPGPMVPGMGGYRVLHDRARVAILLSRLRPQRVEVHDRSTLRWIGAWARQLRIPAMMISHESLTGLLGQLGPGRMVGARIADRLNARTAEDFDVVVCTTAWSTAEFARIGATNVTRASLGVDLDTFSPEMYDPVLRRRHAGGGECMLVHCGRLSVEKRPRRSLATLAALRGMGVPAVLVVAGTGPMESTLRAEAARRGLPVRFAGHFGDRHHLAALLATADVVLAASPIETFGLAALEALASGTPVVVSADSALPEVIGDAGIAASGDGRCYAGAVRHLLSRPVPDRRAAARSQAEKYPWSAAVTAFLRAHETAADRVHMDSRTLSVDQM